MRITMQNGTDIAGLPGYLARNIQNHFFDELKIRMIGKFGNLYYSFHRRIRYFWKFDDISVDKKDFCSNSARCLHQSENVPARCLCLGADSSITFGSQCQYSLPLIAILFISSLCIFIIVIIAAFIIKVCKLYRG